MDAPEVHGELDRSAMLQVVRKPEGAREVAPGPQRKIRLALSAKQERDGEAHVWCLRHSCG